jgi:hypothetical protein
MALATGVFKTVAIKEESAFGTAAGASGAKLLRRVQSTIDLTKDAFESNEIRQSQMLADQRHGTRRVSGQISGELSPTSYRELFEGLLRKDWVAGATTGEISVVAAATSGSTFTRSTGSFLTDGFKVGDVVRWTGFSSTANNNVNYRITALTAAVMTVSGTVVDDAEGDAVTGVATGMKTWIPTTGHTDLSYTIEHWYPDITQSEVFVGCMPSQATINIPANGMGTVAFTMVGKNMTDGTSQYFSTPTALGTDGVLAGVNGVIRIGSTDVAIITGLNVTVNGNRSGDPVVGANTVPALFPGRLVIQGSMSAFFQDATLRDVFLNETETSLNLYLTGSNDANAPFMTLNMSRLKFNSATKNDNERGLVQSIQFVSLEDTAGGAAADTLQTALSIQDSQLS